MSSILHILPTSAAVDAYGRAAAAEMGVMFGTPAVTLRGLADATFTAVGDDRRLISTVGRRLLLEEIVGERYREGKGHFAPLREFPGFLGALDSLFSELKQALVTPPLFFAVARRFPPGAGRMTELAILYEDYARALAD